jgi:transketolase
VTTIGAAQLPEQLRQKADQLRIHSIRSTTQAGSGHPSSCCSAADIVATLFFSVMRYDPKNPRNPDNDRFVLSKGHAAPLLYAAWAEAGLFDPKELLELRTLESDLEGHPTPRLSFVDMATGSLGQGLSVGIGIALNNKYLDKTPARTYVVLGDGESVEGSVWEAADVARQAQLDNLCAIIDVNRLGQSDPTMLEHNLEAYKARWEGFGWHAICVDGHNHAELLYSFAQASQTTQRPTMILAKTFKGKGIPFAEDHPTWHGKPLNAQQADEAIALLNQSISSSGPSFSIPQPTTVQRTNGTARPLPAPPFGPTDSVATREAFGVALVELGAVNPSVVGLDADVKNSTYTDKFGKKFPDRFFENFIAEQNMIGAAAGLAACGKIPFAATFAAFFTRAYDFIRMAAISQSNIKLMGSHVGVSIGEDGPSQMGLEDLAMMAAQPGVVVLYPSDGVCAYRLVESMANHKGMAYMRTGRPKTPILYGQDETFEIGGSKVLRQSDKDQLTIVTAGVTLFEALKAYDELLKSGITVRIIDLYSIVPIDTATLKQAAKATNNLVLTVEDHYIHGGLGDAVLSALSSLGVRLHKMAIQEIAHSGKPAQLLDHYGLSARAIIEKVKQLV